MRAGYRMENLRLDAARPPDGFRVNPSIFEDELNDDDYWELDEDDNADEGGGEEPEVAAPAFLTNQMIAEADYVSAEELEVCPDVHRASLPHFNLNVFRPRQSHDKMRTF